jgi:alpha/beta superfamily hydrolase
MTLRPPPPQRLSITGPAGNLEAVLDDAGTAGPRAFAVVCHPHPQFGGTLDNKVVHTLARTLQEIGIPALRFNYRGVGASAGGFADGPGETDDALAVIDWGRARWPNAQLWLAGFSFGAHVAWRASLVRPCAQLITVAPQVERFRAGDARVPECPWLLIIGDADDVVDPQAMLAWARTLPAPPAIEVLAGAGHYFHGRLHDLKEAVRRGITA